MQSNNSFFERIHKWSRNCAKKLSNKILQKVKLFHIFLAEDAGVGKPHLIKTIYMSVT